MALVVQVWPNRAIQLSRIDEGKSVEKANSPLIVDLEVGGTNPFRKAVFGKPAQDSKKDASDIDAFSFLLNGDQIMVVASGPELDLIRTHMSNIPWVIKSSRNSVIWMGDHAKFIALNFNF